MATTIKTTELQKEVLKKLNKKDKILEPKLVKLRISELKDDPDNPNEMTEAEEEALDLSMKKYGFISPVVVDQDKVIADGHHRKNRLLKMGRKTVMGYILNFKNPEERKLFRQVMNKLRGRHDPLKDALEIKSLLDAGLTDDLKNLIVVNDEQISTIMKVLETDVPIIKEFTGKLDTKTKCPKCGYEY